MRTGSGVAVAENAGAGRSIPAHLAQFAEAQRIIVLDAIRTDLLQPDASPAEPSSSINGAMNGALQPPALQHNPLASHHCRVSAELGVASVRCVPWLFHLAGAGRGANRVHTVALVLGEPFVSFLSC